MPWTPEEFKQKHNKKLTTAQAGKASRQAEAIMASGAPEGVAIATANKFAKKGRGASRIFRKKKK